MCKKRTNDYFIPGDGIAGDVIVSDIKGYLGGDAVVRKGSYEVGFLCPRLEIGILIN